MAGINDAWAERQRRRWMRPDAHLWVRPDASRFMAPGGPRHSGKDVVQYFWPQLHAGQSVETSESKYAADQPRVPAGNSDGGQWTSGGSATSVLVSLLSNADLQSETADGTVLNDASPDPVMPGAQYAQVAIERFEKTGSSDMDQTTETLIGTLARAHTMVGDGAGPLYGTMVHSVFGADVRRQDIPGIGSAGVELSFSLGDVAKYGLDGTIRTDVVLRDAGSPNGKPVAIWDVKTGDARLTGARVKEIREQVGVGAETPVIELHIRRGVTLKGLTSSWNGRGLIAARIWN